MSWAEEYLVKSAMKKQAVREWLGGAVAPLFGGDEGEAALQTVKRLRPQYSAYEGLKGVGVDLPDRFKGIDFAKSKDPAMGQATLRYMSGGKKRPRAMSRKVDLPWENLPSAARAHIISGGKGPYSVSGNLAGAARAAEPARAHLRRLGTKTGLGALGGLGAAWLISRLFD